jgi:hypothetical protein
MSDAMSDYTIDLPLPSGSPAFLSRLRAGRFTSPAGVESSFLFDDLTRARDKRTSAHDIADSDITIIQDLGSGLQVFNLSVYFVGPNCDIEADAFYNSLFERYTPDKPGRLQHPRWGDVNVIPFGSPAQTESFTSGGGISRVTVEFRETVSISPVSSSKLSAGGILAKTGDAKTSALERARRIATTGAKAYSKFKGIVKDKVNRIKTAIDGITGLSEDVRAEVESIHQGILDALTLAATPAIILAQVDAMIETVMSIPQDTVDLANQIIDMTYDVIESFGDDIEGAHTSEDVINTGLTYQAIASSCVSGAANAGLSIQYKTRDQVGAIVDSLSDVVLEYSATMSTVADRIEGNILKSFDPDADLARMMHGIVMDTIALLLDRSFALKSRRVYVLSHPSDVLTECWTRYGSLDSDVLDFFCSTNKIVGNDFIELQAGREIVEYV